LAALALVGVAFAAPRFANAGTVTFEVPTIEISAAQAATGVTGFFDVVAVDTATVGAPDQLGGFAVDVELPNNPDLFSPNYTSPGVWFSNADTSTTATYAFANSNDNQNTIAPDIFPGGTGSDAAYNSDFSTSGTTTFDTATILGLERIQYTVDPGTAAGTYAMTININSGSDDSLTSAFASEYALGINGNSVLPNVVNGAIVVGAPEPASVVLMLFGAIGLIGYGLRRARKA
jgi:hypothetical protein